MTIGELKKLFKDIDDDFLKDIGDDFVIDIIGEHSGSLGTVLRIDNYLKPLCDDYIKERLEKERI